MTTQTPLIPSPFITIHHYRYSMRTLTDTRTFSPSQLPTRRPTKYALKTAGYLSTSSVAVQSADGDQCDLQADSVGEDTLKLLLHDQMDLDSEGHPQVLVDLMEASVAAFAVGEVVGSEAGSEEASMVDQEAVGSAVAVAMAAVEGSDTNRTASTVLVLRRRERPLVLAVEAEALVVVPNTVINRTEVGTATVAVEADMTIVVREAVEVMQTWSPSSLAAVKDTETEIATVVLVDMVETTIRESDLTRTAATMTPGASGDTKLGSISWTPTVCCKG